ncbi:MAG: hypothetical protein COV01_01950 [Candidatus Taylorbacteria bacterium CG10_big_fil_rev_8_21_14_0_10_41_48]|uniref:Uncharacterized protein n=1 Tax=Candidatus Taylorbacteria bacterium CG10_big_fil_rev_8_21_14_0_10_41_48 TaxID=1975024 RepID=A0A2M8LC87_9BACT|nr:MAG: hypothetical protein COV01_01950 [Candidatus Taylorbacteria bacterium CG10_big_fil_rev_8_21_14_0_10_41_48]
MISTSNGHTRARKSSKTTEVRLTDLVPHNSTITTHLQKIDQSIFVIFCINPASSSLKHKCRREDFFSIFNFLNMRAVRIPKIRKMIQSLNATAIERGYIIYQRYLELREQNKGVTLCDAIASLETSARKLVSRLTARARRLMNRICETSVKFRRACKTYGIERILDGIVGTIPMERAQLL